MSLFNNKLQKVQMSMLEQSVQDDLTSLTQKADKSYVDTQIGNIGNASPKGTYTTLTALQTAFPTGTTGIYLVIADGKWYYWSGSAWTAGGVYQSSGIGRGSVAPEYLTFSPMIGTPSKNLFDKTTAIVNSYVKNTDGTIATLAGWYASDFIPVSPSTNYYKNLNTYAVYYDVNKTFISAGTSGVFAITTPANCYYMRITVSSSDLAGLDGAQLELGTTGTSYESHDTKLKSTAIANGTISTSMLNYSPLVGVASKNLFNKTTVTAGKYVSYSTGILNTLSNYSATDYIAVTAGSTYTKNDNGQFAYYDTNKTYVSGVVSGTTFTIPNGVSYMRTAVDSSLLNTFQIELGIKTTSYDTFDLKLNPANFPSALMSTKFANLIVVAKNGGDYNTITSAINAITDSSATNRYTILIMQGTYEESLTIKDKYIDLVAPNLGSVTILDRSGQYATPPINMSSRNNLRNLIVIATHDNVGTYTGEPSYAIHHDADGEGENYIDNCKLISYQSCAIGIGTHNNQQINIRNCELITDTTGVTYTGAGRPTLLMHNYYQTATNQKMTVKNCTLKNTSIGYSVFNITDVNNNGTAGATADNRDTVVAFYNTISWQNQNGKTNVVYTPTGSLATGCIDGYIQLAKDSFGNNVTQLNA